MTHIEIHTVGSPHDLELAFVAGLLDEEVSEVECDLCETIIEFPQKQTAYIILNEDGEVVTCDSCVGLAVTSYMP